MVEQIPNYVKNYPLLLPIYKELPPPPDIRNT